MKLAGVMVGAIALMLAVGGAISCRSTNAGPPPVVLAFGDSVTAGVGDDPAFGGYAARVSGTLQPGESEGAPGIANQHARFLTAAEGGATTDSVLEPNGQLQRAIAEIRARRESAAPEDDVSVILVSIGGNDVYGPLLAACVTAPTPGDPNSRCGMAIGQLPVLSQLVGQNLVALLSMLRAEAGGDTTIVVLTYYNSLAGCELAHLASLGAMVLEGPDGQVASGDGFNDVIRGAVAQVPGAIVAETYGEIGAAELVGGTDCLHPNDAGHARIAEIVLEALDAS